MQELNKALLDQAQRTRKEKTELDKNTHLEIIVGAFVVGVLVVLLLLGH